MQLLAKGHLLLCTLVVWNAACMEALPIFLDRLADPVTAILISVSVVLIFGAPPAHLVQSCRWQCAQAYGTFDF